MIPQFFFIVKKKLQEMIKYFFDIDLQNCKTATASATSQIDSVMEDNLETFLLYWLDAEVNISDHNKIVQKQLNSIVNHLEIFDDLSQCQQTIESLSKQDRLILIVSGRLGRQIVPQIHHLRQLLSIYVYCTDKLLNEEWSKQFRKV